MKIILGGGWGYGNVGDDLILSSTINMLDSVLSVEEFTVLTYDKIDSSAHLLAPRVKLEKNIHSYVDMNNTKYKFCKIGNKKSLHAKVMERVTKKIGDSKLYFDKCSSKYRDEFYELFESHDAYIMCGGGYFNEKWLSKFRSQLQEIKIAQEKGLKTMIMGPTIGRIPKHLTKDAFDIFSKVDKIIVRDLSSKNTLSELGVEAIILSDIAMSCWEVKEPKLLDDVINIGIAYTSSKNELENIIVNDLVKFHEEKGKNVKYTFIITRQWNGDILSGMSMMESLKERGICSKIIIPSEHVSLENEMQSFDMVISENLHGLISASRNLIPVIAINDYSPDSPNGKKFKGFLDQFEISDYYINSSSGENKLFEKLVSISNDYVVLQENLKAKRAELKENYEREIKSWY